MDAKTQKDIDRAAKNNGTERILKDFFKNDECVKPVFESSGMIDVEKPKTFVGSE